MQLPKSCDQAGTDVILDLGAGRDDVLLVSAGAIANATLAGAWVAGAWVASGNVSNAGQVNITDFGAAGVDILNSSAEATALVTLRTNGMATDASGNLGVASLIAAGFDVNLQAVRGTAGWNASNAGNANAVWLNGSTRNDALAGGGGADWLRGGQGDDTLDGGAGADTVHGGDGTNRLTGGSGADVFVFLDTHQLWGDVITDFNAAEGDRLDLREVDAGREPEERQMEFIGSGPFSSIIFEGEPTGVNKSGAMRFENGWLQFDVNADGVADRQMRLLGVTTLRAEDMWL